MINTIISYLKSTAERFPDKIAFCDAEKSITFGELNRCAQSLACKIYRNLNGGTQKAIGVYLPKGVDCIIAFMAVAYSGNYYTPIDISMPESRYEKIIHTLNPKLMLTTQTLVEKIKNTNTLILEDNISDETDTAILEKIENTAIDTDVLYVMFTSGSTGDPKGVIISHRAVIDYIDWVTDTFHFNETTIFGNQAPFYFDNSVLDIYSTIRNGCTMVIIPEEKFLSGMRLCTFIEEKKINTIFWVPSAMILVANTQALDNVSVDCLKYILFAGEVMPTKQLNIWRKHIPNAVYANLYGPTEIAVDCTYYIVDREFQDTESLPIGKACRNTGVLVLNDNGQPVKEGEVGELCVRGSCVALGYYGNSDKTKEAFVQNPLNKNYPEIIYKTGDLVKYNEHGEILYVGRKDFQIKHRGYRIELGEIETAVSSFENVEMCCAMYDQEEKKIVVCVTPNELDKKKLYIHLKERLPQYMMPGLIITQEKLPLNKNGKIDRTVLRERVNDKI